MNDTFRRMPRAAWPLAFLLASNAAADPGSHPCSSVASPTERLACFDRAFPPAGTDRPAPAGVAGAAAVPAGSTTQASSSTVPAQTPPARTARDDVPDVIAANVTDVGKTAEGRLVVTLNNGQTWMQTDSTTAGGLRPGARIRIEKAALGSFAMVGPDRRVIRVRRVK